MTPTSPPVRIGIRLDSTKSFHRACLRGLLNYIRQHKPRWSLTSDTANRMWLVRPDELPDFHPDILLGVFSDNELLDLRRKHVRCLSLLTHVTDGLVPVIASDDVAIGKIAAGHFIDQNIRNGLYYAIVRQQTHSTLRFAGFRQTLIEAGASEPAAIQLDLNRVNFRRRASRQKHLSEIAARIRGQIAKGGAPLGVFCFSDDLGATVIEACAQAGLSVPDEVAVVGVDNDNLICDMMSPALSSVQQNGEGIGYKTGEVLEAMFRPGAKVPKQTLLPPLSIVIRPSSDTISVEDPILRRAIQIIRGSLTEAVNVNELANQLKVSRRLLAKRFREKLNRSAHEEIVLTRVRAAKQLLATTTMTNLAVALECGFNGEHRFEQNFRTITGMTPMAYRKHVCPTPVRKR